MRKIEIVLAWSLAVFSLAFIVVSFTNPMVAAWVARVVSVLALIAAACMLLILFDDEED